MTKVTFKRLVSDIIRLVSVVHDVTTRMPTSLGNSFIYRITYSYEVSLPLLDGSVAYPSLEDSALREMRQNFQVVEHSVCPRALDGLNA